jgi:AhpD family alkylhydroperoxidase
MAKQKSSESASGGKGSSRKERIDQVVRRAEEKRGYSPFWLRFMGEVDLEYLEAYSALYETVAARSIHIPLKYKELITVTALAVKREDFGIGNHIKRALRLGVTKEEIVEALQAASFHTGALTLVHGLKSLLEVLKEQKTE